MQQDEGCGRRLASAQTWRRDTISKRNPSRANFRCARNTLNDAERLLSRRSQASLEGVCLTTEGPGQAISEFREVFPDARYFGEPAVNVDLQQIVQIGRRQWQSIRIQVVFRRQATDWRIVGMDTAIAALEDPFQDAAVLAETGPKESIVFVLTKPVDVEELGQLRRIGRGAQFQPL